MNQIRRALVAAVAATTALGVAAGLTTAPVQAASAQEAVAKAAAPKKSRFALRGWAYGTAINAGPLASGPTGYQSIGCTTRTGLVRANNVAQANLPQLGKVGALSSRVWTTRSGKTVSSWSRNSIGQITLSDSPLGTLVLDAVTSTSRAFHDGSRFRTSADVDVAKLVFKPRGLPAQTLKLPKPGRPIVIAGFGRVAIASTDQRTTAHSALAVANGLLVTLTATNTSIRVGRSVAQINDGIVSGVFGGNSYGVGGTVVGELAQVGRNPYLPMPCTGTAGETQTRRLVGLDLGPVSVGAAVSQQRTVQTRNRAAGWERSQVASIKIGDALQINGAVAQAAVSRSGKKLKVLKRSTAGTRIGSIVVNGTERELSSLGTLNLPGIAKLESRVITKLPNGLAVTALRVTLLDGTGAVLNLGNARMVVRRSGR